MSAAGHKGGRGRRIWLWILAALVAIVLVLGAVLGGVLGSRAANDHKNNSVKSAKDGQGGVGSSAATLAATTSDAASTSATLTTSSAAPTSTPAGNTFKVVDLPPWSWGQNKSIGMCLGAYRLARSFARPSLPLLLGRQLAHPRKVDGARLVQQHGQRRQARRGRDDDGRVGILPGSWAGRRKGGVDGPLQHLGHRGRHPDHV